MIFVDRIDQVKWAEVIVFIDDRDEHTELNLKIISCSFKKWIILRH